jgi:membrane protease YdiL (CAAX protease family)
VAGKFSLLEPGFKTVMLVLLTALVKTALTEEILFRGFIAKRCISLLGFTYGNALQAFIFGGLHFLLFMALSNSLLLPFFIFLVSGTSSYLKVVLNEKNANGSILPGWSAHAVANLSMYLTALFIL